MPQHGTIHDSLYNAFSFGLFAAYELESEDRNCSRNSSANGARSIADRMTLALIFIKRRNFLKLYSLVSKKRTSNFFSHGAHLTRIFHKL
jgi:hypothetical protein